MNDTIQFIIFNLLMVFLLFYDKRYGIVLIIFMILYWVTIKSSTKYKLVEGYDLYFRDIFYMNEFDDRVDYGYVLPTSIQYNSDKKESSNVFSFFKGDGKDGIIKSGNVSLYKETDELMDELIDFLDKTEDNCSGEFKRGKCSKECGKGKQKVTYHLDNELMDDSKCDYEKGKTYYDNCYLKSCEDHEPCSDDNDCRVGQCLKGKCTSLFGCDKDEFLINCDTKKDCLHLNTKYGTEKYKYKWDGLKCSQTDKKEYKGKYDDVVEDVDVDGLKITDIKGFGDVGIAAEKAAAEKAAAVEAAAKEAAEKAAAEKAAAKEAAEKAAAEKAAAVEALESTSCGGKPYSNSDGICIPDIHNGACGPGNDYKQCQLCTEDPIFYSSDMCDNCCKYSAPKTS